MSSSAKRARVQRPVRANQREKRVANHLGNIVSLLTEIQDDLSCLKTMDALDLSMQTLRASVDAFLEVHALEESSHEQEEEEEYELSESDTWSEECSEHSSDRDFIASSGEEEEEEEDN